jgi:hypothetical protein
MPPAGLASSSNRPVRPVSDHSHRLQRDPSFLGRNGVRNLLSAILTRHRRQQIPLALMSRKAAARPRQGVACCQLSAVIYVP